MTASDSGQPNDATNPWPRHDDLADPFDEEFYRLIRENPPAGGTNPTTGGGQGNN
ncbi:hypothetical protein AB0L00_09905 [Actinoallomurus sp. NPDC052308]|uniref:hypothetical protein n=1 Tax=Actinoallomurus sp. NPDC052308 TaxID=3155530 RepID=UPI00342E6797